MNGSIKNSSQDSKSALRIISDADKNGYEIRVEKNGNIRKADFVDKLIEFIFVRIFPEQKTDHKKLALEATLYKLCKEIIPEWKGKFDDAKAYICDKIPDAKAFLSGTKPVNEFESKIENFKNSISECLPKFLEKKDRVEKINSMLPEGMNISLENKTCSKKFNVFQSKEEENEAIAEINKLKKEGASSESEQFKIDLHRMRLSTKINNELTEVRLDGDLARNAFDNFCTKAIESKTNLSNKKRIDAFSNLKARLAEQINQDALGIVYARAEFSMKSKNGDNLAGKFGYEIEDRAPDKFEKNQAPIKYALRHEENGDIFIAYKEQRKIPSFDYENTSGTEAIPICTGHDEYSSTDDDFNIRVTWEIKLKLDDLLKGDVSAEFSKIPELELRIKLLDEKVKPASQ